MSQKNTYHLADEHNNLIAVEGADVRDQHANQGWTVVQTPPPSARVWTQHEETKAYALFPLAVLDVWKARGWQPAVPPTEATDTGLTVVLPDTAPAAQTIADVPPANAPSLETDNEGTE